MSKKNRSKEPAPGTAKPQAEWWRIFAGAALLLVATIIVYIPAIRAGFIWDDPEYVLNNPTLRTFDGLRQMWLVPTSLPQWYPLVHTTFWIEYHLVGIDPTLYHVDNVILHAISCLLLWRILKKLEVPGGFIAACLFAVHPVMVESVAWVTERKNVLSLVFYLLALRVYLFQFEPTNHEGKKPDYRAYALALVFFLAALFSKTVTASLPAAVLLILWWKNGRLRLRDLVPLIPFFVLGIAMGAFTGYLESTHVDANGQLAVELHFSFAQRCLIAGRAIWFYLGKLFFPYRLTFIYPRWTNIESPPASQWIFPALVVFVTIALLASHRTGRGTVTAWLLFCGTLFPALGFVNVYPMRYSFVADHFQYHAAIAIFVLISATLATLPLHPRAIVSGIVVVVLGCLTWNQSRIYASAQTLWNDTVRKNPDSWMVWMNLGNLLAAQEKYDDAIPYYRKALELAPNVDETRWNAGMAFARQKDFDEAERQFNRAIEINPRFAGAYESLGELYLYDRNDADRAIDYLKKSLEIAPGFAKAEFNYGVALERQADQAKAQAVKSKDPADAQRWVNALSDAVDHYRSALAGNPEYAEAHYNLASCLMQLRQTDEAILHLREAVRIKPDYAEAWLNLGSDLFIAGKFGEAAHCFQQALLLRPNWEIAQKNLQAARARM